MKQKAYIITLILWSISSLYTLTSCSNKKEQATAVDQSLFFDASQVDTLLSETIERIDFLDLEATDNSDVFGVSKMIIKIDFADKIPDEFRKERKKILENEYNFMLQTPILCKNYMAFEISVGDNIFSYIYDENAGCFHGNAEVSSYNYLFEPITSYKDQLVSYLDNYSLYEEVVETGFAKASPEIERHLKNEGAILILYTMR